MKYPYKIILSAIAKFPRGQPRIAYPMTSRAVWMVSLVIWVVAFVLAHTSIRDVLMK